MKAKNKEQRSISCSDSESRVSLSFRVVIEDKIAGSKTPLKEFEVKMCEVVFRWVIQAGPSEAKIPLPRTEWAEHLKGLVSSLP